MRIQFIQYCHPAAYPPIINAASILQEQDHDIHCIGVQDSNLRQLVLPTSLQQTYTGLRQPSNKPGLKLFYVWFALRTLVAARRIRPDLLYVSDSAACLAARLALRVTNAPVIYHEHDVPYGSGGIKGGLLGAMRGSVSRRAVACVIPNRERAKAFIKQISPTSNIEIVWNCPRLSELRPLIQCPRVDPLKPLYLLYVGSLNEQRTPLTLIDALKREPRIHLRLIGYETIGSRGFTDRFLKYARSLEVQERISFAGPQSRTLVFDSLSAGHVGLSLMPMQTVDPNMKHMVGASNKSFEALACGLPILTNNLPSWKKAFVDAGVARGCDPRDPDSIARALSWFCDNPTLTSEMGKRGRELVEKSWNYDSQFAPVAAVIRRLATVREKNK